MTLESDEAADASFDMLFKSAQRWMQEALSGSNSEDPARTSLMAPIAIELLGKATLWKKNPVLLAPQGNDDSTLLQLASRPDLLQPRIRTIGLAVVLARLERLYDSFTLPEGRRKRLVDVRNGAIHIGAHAEADNILMDCLSVARSLLGAMDVSEASFFGPHQRLAAALLDEQRKSQSGRLAVKRERAAAYLADLENRLGRPAFDAVCIELEAQRMTLASDNVLPGGTSIDANCPECESKARLFGYLDAEIEVDWDVEPIGGGEYVSYAVGGWEMLLTPEHLVCTVCNLQLTDRTELELAGAPSRRMVVTEDELNEPGFDYNAFIRHQERWDE